MQLRETIIHKIQNNHKLPALIMSENDALEIINILTDNHIIDLTELYTTLIPGVRLYEKEEGKKDIGIGVVRRFLSDISIRSYETTAIYIIKDLDTATLEAMNALLKVLEDIPDGVIIIGTVTKYESLLETVRSRMMLLSTNTTYTPLPRIEEQEAIKRYIEGDIKDLLLLLFSGKFTKEEAVSLVLYYFNESKYQSTSSEIERFESTIETLLLTNEPVRNILDDYFLPRI